MNVSQIVERTKEAKIVLDKLGKELHIGDIVLVVINYGDLEKCIVTGFTNRGIKLLNLTYPKEFIYCNKQIVNANCFFDKEEIERFKNIKNSFVDKKVNRVLNKQILYAFYDKSKNKYGMFVSGIQSLPGKNFSKKEYEEFHQKLLEKYPNIDFYPFSFTKQIFGKRNEVPINSIFLDKTSTSSNFYYYEKIDLTHDKYYIFDLYNITNYRFVKHTLINQEDVYSIFPENLVQRYTQKYEDIQFIIRSMIDFITEKMNGK